MTFVLLVLIGLSSADSAQATRFEKFGAWILIPAAGPILRASIEAIPPDHAELNPAAAAARALVVRCSGTRLTAELHASTRRGIEPESSDMATPAARVKVAFDDGAWEAAMWTRQHDALKPPAKFLDRLAGAREARVEVPIMCRGCGAAPHIVFRIDAAGFAEGRDALLRACRTGATD